MKCSRSFALSFMVCYIIFYRLCGFILIVLGIGALLVVYRYARRYIIHFHRLNGQAIYPAGPCVIPAWFFFYYSFSVMVPALLSLWTGFAIIAAECKVKTIYPCQGSTFLMESPMSSLSFEASMHMSLSYGAVCLETTTFVQLKLRP